jgi:hypothetical protein
MMRLQTARNRGYHSLFDVPSSAKGAAFISKAATGRIRRGEPGAAPKAFGAESAIHVALQFESTR